MERDDAVMEMEGEETRGQKRGSGADDDEATRPRVYGFDDDVEGGEMVASLMEMGNEDIIEEIFAVLDEEMLALAEEWCLQQPESLDSQAVPRNRGT